MPEAVGQINMYFNYYKTEVNDDTDNEPIGIILCTDKDSIQAEYALGSLSNKIFASKYTLYMKLSKKKPLNFQPFQQQRSVHSLKLRKSVPNVWPSVRANCQQKPMTSSWQSKSTNGSNGKKKLALTFLYTVSLSVMTWLSTSVKTCQVTSSLRMVGYNHTVCVG